MNITQQAAELRSEIRQLLLCIFSPSSLEEEKARRELNQTLSKNWPRQPIQVYELIGESREAPPSDTDFLVFIDDSLDIDWITEKNLSEKASECISSAESIAAKRCKHLPKEQVLEFRRMIGQAIVSGIRGNEKQSARLTSEASQFLKDRTIERSRTWTLSSAHGLCLILIGLFALLIRAPITKDQLMELPLAAWLTLLGGISGAYLSVIQKAGSGEWDAASGHKIHMLEVGTKFMAGAIFGIIAYALSQSAHAPASFKSITPDSYSLFLFGFSAGLFERTVPKMVSQYAQTNNTQKPLP